MDVEASKSVQHAQNTVLRKYVQHVQAMKQETVVQTAEVTNIYQVNIVRAVVG